MTDFFSDLSDALDAEAAADSARADELHEECRAIARSIPGATSLSDLHAKLEALRDAYASLRTLYDAPHFAPCAETEFNVDVSSLPTFGGAEPADTIGIYSWDETHVLVGEDGWSIEARRDEAEKVDEAA